jgi:hypothetical protein
MLNGTCMVAGGVGGSNPAGVGFTLNKLPRWSVRCHSIQCV